MTFQRILPLISLCCLLMLGTSGMVNATAQSATDWAVVLGVNGGVIGAVIGVDPNGYDDYPGTGDPIVPDPSSVGIFLLRHYINGPNWSGPTGFTSGDLRRTPVTAGASKSWLDLYLWAQNKTPGPANLTLVYSGIGPYSPPPAGYRGHLVLDYVPDSCNWTGKPMDYWLDLTANNQIALPIPVVTDPLQGTRFHLDVYAPVPEPSCLAALGMGLAGIVGTTVRRRKG